MASGFNIVDFMDLSPIERCILRLVLRETSVTYSELQEAIKTLPADQQMDQTSFDSALDHLTLSEWLISQGQNQQISYRVNTLHKTTHQSQGTLEGLDLEKIDQPRLNLEPATSEHTVGSSRGKRVLPTHIWDCLTEPPAAEPISEPPKRRTSLFDKLIDEGGTK